MKNKSDEGLVEEIKKGNILAFETLVERYEAKLLNFVFGITGDEPLSEEVVQDAFLAIYKKIDNIDTSRKFSSYFYKVAKNLAISEIRKLKPQISLEEAGEIEHAGDDILEQIRQKERGQEVAAATGKLDDKYRQVIKLFYFEELSYKKIAQRLGLPINTVRTRLKRAKNLLKKELVE